MTWCWSSVVKPMRPQHFRGMGHGRRRTMAESSGSDQGFFHFEAVEIGWNDLEKGGRVWKLQSFYWNLLKTSKSAYEDMYLIVFIYTYNLYMYVCMWLISMDFLAEMRSNIHCFCRLFILKHSIAALQGPGRCLSHVWPRSHGLWAMTWVVVTMDARTQQ